jgi:hypothetical protein
LHLFIASSAQLWLRTAGEEGKEWRGFAFLLPFAQISMGASDLIVKAIFSKTLATCDERKKLNKMVTAVKSRLNNCNSKQLEGNSTN